MAPDWDEISRIRDGSSPLEGAKRTTVVSPVVVLGSEDVEVVRHFLFFR